jgi:hypothetical protein
MHVDVRMKRECIQNFVVEKSKEEIIYETY